MRRGAVALAAAGVCLLLTACEPAEDEVRAVTLGSAPPAETRITVPEPGPEGFTPPGSWPKACDLLTETDLQAVLPDITHLTQEPRQLRFTVRTPDGISRGERGIPGGHCQYIFYLSGTETEEYRETYKGWLNVTVDVAGAPDIVERNFELLAHGEPVDAPGAAECVTQSASEVLCRTKKLAFTVHAVQLPYGFRFEGQPADAENVTQLFTEHFHEHGLPELVRAVTSKLRRS
jgi:hypothetical protein